MQPIKSLLNKIKWDTRENPKNYKILYFDRLVKKLIKIPYAKIKRIEDRFMVLDNEEESNILLHRIKKVMNNGVVVWERK